MRVSNGKWQSTLTLKKVHACTVRGACMYFFGYKVVPKLVDACCTCESE